MKFSPPTDRLNAEASAPDGSPPSGRVLTASFSSADGRPDEDPPQNQPSTLVTLAMLALFLWILEAATRTLAGSYAAFGIVLVAALLINGWLRMHDKRPVGVGKHIARAVAFAFSANQKEGKVKAKNTAKKKTKKKAKRNAKKKAKAANAKSQGGRRVPSSVNEKEAGK